MDLTISQLNLLIEVIGDRLSKQGANQALVMRLAIASSLSKEGAEVFQRFIDETFRKEETHIILRPDELSKFGMKKR